MVRKELIEKILYAASIQRWNDHPRPVQLTELDKQAHKMIIAYVIAKFEEQDKHKEIDWIGLIRGGFFEFLQRVVLTDLKPQVYHLMMKTAREDINACIFKDLENDLSAIGGNFQEKFRSYLFDKENNDFEKKILKASHYLATEWEFKLIYQICPFMYGIEKTKESIENQIEDHFDLIGVQKIALKKKSYGFIDLCGQLRFQKRWAQTPRIPETSVLGHSLIVALLSYLCSIEIGACDRRIYNNFFSALFHDLPEIITRDIVTPVKNMIEGMEDLIKKYEENQIDNEILPLLPSSWHEEFKFLLKNLDKNRIINDGVPEYGITDSDMKSKYNFKKFSPLDGRIIKACDHIAAFIEASSSISHGVRSQQLFEGLENKYRKCKNMVVSGIDFGKLFDAFYPEDQMN